MDRAILRVAVWELLHAEDVPEPVAVDEAVELAKQLSTDDSPGFVNGVLGQVMLVTPQIRAAAAAVQGGGEGGIGTLELRNRPFVNNMCAIWRRGFTGPTMRPSSARSER